MRRIKTLVALLLVAMVMRADASRLSPPVSSAALLQYSHLLQGCAPNGPLGLTTGDVGDAQITASSTYPSDWEAGCLEKYGRLYQPNGLAWCAKYKSASEWLQVDLGVPAKVTGLMTQGRADGQEWVTSFVVSYSLDAINWFYVVDEYDNKLTFEGNVDSYSVKHTYLDDVIILRYVKFHPVTWNRHPSMRVEVVGCQVCKSLISLPPYSKIDSSGERHKSDGSSCGTQYGFIITDKGWCPRRTNDHQWLQFDVGPPKLIAGIVTKGRGDRNHWVTKYRIAYSNDSLQWHFYTDTDHHNAVTEFTGNADRDGENHQYLRVPVTARYVRIHPTHWHRQIGLRAGLLGCPHTGECSQGFVRINNNSPCVENLAYKKESFVNNRRQYKRHTRRRQHQTDAADRGDDPSNSIGDRDSDHRVASSDQLRSGGGVHSCTVLDNFYVERPVWMVDLGKKTTVSGVIIVTWPGNPNDGRAGYKDYIHNLDKLTVYIDDSSHRNYYTRTYHHSSGSGARRRAGSKRAATRTDPGLVCGSRARAAVATAAGDAGQDPGSAGVVSDVPLAAPFPAKIHLPCRQPLQGRYVFVEASGVATRYSRLFGAILCDVIVYQ